MKNSLKNRSSSFPFFFPERNTRDEIGISIGAILILVGGRLVLRIQWAVILRSKSDPS